MTLHPDPFVVKDAIEINIRNTPDKGGGKIESVIEVGMLRFHSSLGVK